MRKHSAHIFAVEPGPASRRKVWGQWTKVWRLLWSSDLRCRTAPNPKRPTWRCKAMPEYMVAMPDGKSSTILCGVHYREFGGRVVPPGPIELQAIARLRVDSVL